MSMSEGPVSPERTAWLRRRRRDRLLVRSAKIGLLAGLLLIWETAARWGAIDPFPFYREHSEPHLPRRTLAAPLRHHL